MASTSFYFPGFQSINPLISRCDVAHQEVKKNRKESRTCPILIALSALSTSTSCYSQGLRFRFHEFRMEVGHGLGEGRLDVSTTFPCAAFRTNQESCMYPSPLRMARTTALLVAMGAALQAAGDGGITVTVTNTAGAPVPGATVTISSPTQIGGARTEAADHEGKARFLRLIRFLAESSG